ncbi:hypothetical protein SFR_2752 [Streptomyces sp. FR-008]|nr:hypothetical protein SFR_2752 [Streptomyces sp. FR-008]
MNSHDCSGSGGGCAVPPAEWPGSVTGPDDVVDATRRHRPEQKPVTRLKANYPVHRRER